MKTNQQGLNLIKSFEKCKLKAYQVKGDKVTIGWGNTYYEDNSPIKLSDTITQERADKLFLFVLSSFESQLAKLITSPINENQFSALVSFAYNLGIGNLKTSTLLKLVNKNPNDPQIRNEFLKWVSPGTIFTKGLRIRRTAEADLYFSIPLSVVRNKKIDYLLIDRNEQLNILLNSGTHSDTLR